MAAQDPIRFYRGLQAGLPVLQDGMPGWTTDTKRLYVGQGGVNTLVGPGGGGFVTAVSDTATIDLTVSSGTLSGVVLTQMSVAGGAAALKLVGDLASPGASKLYGTDAAGTRGWYAQPTATNEGVWRFDATSTAMADPGAGKLRFSNAAASSVTSLALSATTDPGASVANFLRGLKAGDTIYVQEKADSSHWARFALTATPLDNTTWFQLPVNYVGASGVAPTNNSQLAVVFTTGAGGAQAGRTSVTPAAIQQTAAGDGTLIPAPAAGTRIKLLRVEASNSHATAAAVVGLKAASLLSGAVFGKRYLPGAGGAAVWQFADGQLLLGLAEALLVNLNVASQIEWTCYYEIG